MTSYYSIIKYVPDPIADESINVGVIVFSGETVKLKTTKNLSRAHSFSNKNNKVLLNTLSDLTGMVEANELSPSQIQKFSETWLNQIQLTNPRASNQSVDDLLNEVFPLFLSRESTSIITRKPGKRHAVKLAADSIASQLIDRFHPTSKASAMKLIKRDYSVLGNLESHELDLAIVNGSLKNGAIALSFTKANKNQIRRDIDATAFALEDMRKINKDTPFYIIGISEGAEIAEIRSAEKFFMNWNVPVITELEMEDWSKEVVNSLPSNVLHD